MYQILMNVPGVARRESMKKFKLALAIIWYVLLTICIIVAITFPSIITIYLSNKVLPFGLILIFATLMITNMVKELFDKNKILIKVEEKVRSFRGNFDWTPNTPIKNTKEGKLIETYPKDYKFNFRTFEIESEKVQGSESFKQSLVKFVNTPKHKYRIYKGTNYGTEHNLFTCESTEEFTRQANNLAEQILDYYGEWVEKIYRVKRENHYLIIEMKVFGIPSTFSVTIPDLEYYAKHKAESK